MTCDLLPMCKCVLGVYSTMSFVKHDEVTATVIFDSRLSVVCLHVVHFNVS